MPPPASRWKAPRSRGIQKSDKKGSGAPVVASEPLFTVGAVTENRSSPFRENGTAERPQTLRCPKIINVFPLKMPKATRRPFKSLYPRKGRRITSGRSVLPPRPCGWPSWWRCAPRCGCRRTFPRSRTLPCLPAQPAGCFPAQGRSGWWGSP